MGRQQPWQGTVLLVLPRSRRGSRKRGVPSVPELQTQRPGFRTTGGRDLDLPLQHCAAASVGVQLHGGTDFGWGRLTAKPIAAVARLWAIRIGPLPHAQRPASTWTQRLLSGALRSASLVNPLPDPPRQGRAHRLRAAVCAGARRRRPGVPVHCLFLDRSGSGFRRRPARR